jgi:hypothetical protein
MLSLTLGSLRRLWSDSLRGAAEALPFVLSRPPQPGRAAGSELIYRLKSWPQLSDGARTAEIFRILSVMSSQPVSRQWLDARCSLAPEELDKFLAHLADEGALEVIDPARFAGREHARA